MDEKKWDAKLKLRIGHKMLSDAIESLTVLLDEATFQISEAGIAVRAMDPSHVAMVSLDLWKMAFEEYELESEAKFALNLAEFQKVVKRARKDDVIALEYGEEKMKLEIKGAYYRLFSFKTLDPETEVIPTPNLSWDAVAQVSTEGFRRALEDVSLSSDSVVIEMQGGELKISAGGYALDADIRFRAGDEDLLSCDVTEKATARFSLNYFLDIMKAVKEADLVKIHLKNDMPLKLEFQLPYPGTLDYHLAPRIESM